MKGWRVAVDKRLSMLPNVNIRVIAIRKPNMVFITSDHMMDLGITIDASRTSSAISLRFVSALCVYVRCGGGLTHVNNTIKPSYNVDRNDRTNHGRKAYARPAAVVTEFDQNVWT